MTIAPPCIPPATTTQDPYALAQAAAKLLASNPADEKALALYANALLMLKLHAALGTLTQNTSLTTGLIPWSSRARRFQANLTTLTPRTAPETIAAIQSAAAMLPVTHQLHQSADSNFHILNLQSQSSLPFAWLGGLANHKASTNLWIFDPAKTPIVAPLAFDGLSHGHLFLHIFNTTHRSFLDYSCPLYVLESNPLHLAILLHLHDFAQIFPSPRLRLFLNPDQKENLAAFQRALTENPTWTLPQKFVLAAFEPRPALPLEQTVAAIRMQRDNQNTALLAQIQSHYADKDQAYWRRRFEAALSGEQPPLKILGITSRYTTVLKHSLAEMQTAIDSSPIPASMQIAIEPDDQSLENPYVQLLADIKPDLIFQISRLRHENPNLPKNVPFLCWDQDNLPCMRTHETTTSLLENPLTFIAGHAAIHGHCYLNWPRQNLIFCHPAGATHRYVGVRTPQPLLDQYACDVSFVSNASEPPAQFRDRLAQPWQQNPQLAAIFAVTSDAILIRMHQAATWDYHTLRMLIRQHAPTRSTLTNAAENELILSLITLSDRCFRHTALHWIRQWCLKNNRSLRLYGQGWDKHPDFAPHAAGYAAQGDQLMAIYHASKINLQLMESGGFLHSRTLDGLAAGAFFLTRTSPNDGADHKYVEAQATLAHRATQLHLVTIRDLEISTDPEIQRTWAIMRPFFIDSPKDDRFAGITLWNHNPPARVVFPPLAQLSFSNAQEFENLAERYLADDALRQNLTDQMRQIVQRDQSYIRRWTDFLAAVTQSLQQYQSRAPHEIVPAVLVNT